MSVRIPLSLRPQVGNGGTAAPGVRLNVPPLLGLGARTPGIGMSRRAAQQLRAVAAAVAATHPRQALRLVIEAREDPDTVVLADNGEPLKTILAAISRVQDDRANPPTPDALARTVARAVGADPVLVAAATATIDKDDENDPVARSGGYWVAALDLNLLERAARAAVRARALRHVPDQSTRLGRLEEAVKALRADVDQLSGAGKAATKR